MIPLPRVSLIFLLILPASLTAQELAPPDVTFFAGLGSSQTDFSPLGVNEKVQGIRLNGGLWLNDANLGRWVFGVEAAYNRLGDTSASNRFVREPTAQELSQQGNLDFVTVITERDRDIGGLELGLRLYDSELFYLRGGGFLYSFRSRSHETRVLTDVNGNSTTNDLTPQSQSTSTLGPYLGAGFIFPVSSDIRLITDFSVYQVESENLKSLSLGLQYQPGGND